MLKSRRTIGLWLAGALGAAVAFAQTPNYPELMFVVDSSGSMQAQMQGRTKLDIAKDVLREVTLKLPPEVKLGLAAYGHRQARDCQDFEILIPPGSEDRAALTNKVAALRPVGMTPIALALQKTTDALQGRKAETTIVLLTDGLETCGGDPGAVIGSARRKGLSCILYVVGYDIKENEKKALEKLAEAGGGKYFAANDSAALLAVFETLRKEVETKVEKARTEKVQRKTGLGKLRISLPPDALKSLAGIQIRRPGSDSTVKKGELTTADSLHPLPSGAYELWLDFANPNYKPPTPFKLSSFEIEPGSETKIALGSLGFNMAEGLADLNIEFLQILDRATGKAALQTDVHGNDYYLFKAKPLPEGSYDLAIGYTRSPKPMLLATNLAVKSGAQTTVTLDSGLLLKKPTATSVTGWDLYRKATGEKVLEVRRRSDNQEPLWRRFIVPPGVYELKVWVKDMTEPLPAGEQLEIGSGQMLEFDTGL